MPSMRSYTVAKKIEVVQWHRQGRSNAHGTSRHFNIDCKEDLRVGQQICSLAATQLWQVEFTMQAEQRCSRIKRRS
ncbi:hypothetical protein MRX96_039969 [Rhipicephalus microplus]